MPEQDYVTIPNVANSQIAADDPSGAGVGPFVQQVSIANLSATLRNLEQQLAVLGTAQDPSTGRLRILVDAITAALTLTTLTTVTTVTNVTNMTQISGFGPANTLVTAAHYMPLDIMTDAWANSVRRNIT